MDSTILELARQLGVAADELIGYYMQRVPALWIAPIMAGGIFAVSLLSAIFSCVKGSNGGDDDVYIPLFIVSVAITLISGIIAAATFYDAYVANAAPQAYAVDQILRALGR